MTPYHNPRVYLANLVKFVYDKEQKKYVPLILNAKMPVVLIPGYGYYTDKMDCNMPLSIVDVNNYGKVKANKFYITNVKSIDRYTDNPSDLLHNWYANSMILNEQLGLDCKWHTKEELALDKPEYRGVLPEYDLKLDETLYVAKMATKVKNFQNYDGYLIKDEYINISNNFGLFSLNKKGRLESKTTGYEYEDLSYNDLFNTILSFDIDLEYISNPIYSREELGLTNIYDLHDFVTTFHLYLDPNKNILNQINSYNDLKKGIKLRNVRDLKNFSDDIILPNYQRELLNKDIAKRTLKK